MTNILFVNIMWTNISLYHWCVLHLVVLFTLSEASFHCELNAGIWRCQDTTKNGEGVCTDL